MAIDFQKEEGRKNYLTEKLDDLLTGINDTYGKALMNELVSRLENTVKDFNDEVGELMLQLKDNLEEKMKMLQNIKTGNSEPEKPSPAEPAALDPEASDWEKRLEKLG